MDPNLDFDTFLYVSSEKFIISIFEKTNFRSIYSKEFLIDIQSNQINFEKLNYFIENNIHQIEKEIKNFIKNIYLIIDCEEFFTTKLSIKKNNNNKIISLDLLVYLLNEAKEQCKKTLENKKIIHLIIDKYSLDGSNYFYLPKSLKCKNLCLDLSFICLSFDFIKKFENLFKKYQISVNQILNSNYIEKFSKEKNIGLFSSANKIILGYNENEVKFVEKTTKNKGFFEKFFDFFS